MIQRAIYFKTSKIMVGYHYTQVFSKFVIEYAYTVINLYHKKYIITLGLLKVFREISLELSVAQDLWDKNNVWNTLNYLA